VPRHVARLVTRHVARLVAPLVVDYSVSHRLVVDYSASHRLDVDYFASAARPGASARRAARHATLCAAHRRLLRLTQARHRLLRIRRASGCLGTSRGSSCGSLSTISPRVGSYAARPGASARRAACRAAHHRLLRLAQACHPLLRLRRATGCLGTSRGSSRGSSRRSSSTTLPRAGSSLTTSPTPRVWVPRHVARLITRLVAPLVVDYSASCRLIVDYFASAARPGASARRAAHHLSSTTPPRPRVRVPQHVKWLISPLIIDYSASHRLIVDYFASAARPGASAHRAARHAALRAARHRLLRLAQACRRLLCLRRASGCLDMSCSSSRGSSRRSSPTTPPRAGSSSTTSPPPRVRVPRRVAQLVTRLVAPLIVDYSAVDYFAYATRPGASARRTARQTACRRLLRAPRLLLAATLALLQPSRASRLLVSRQHWLYFEYAARRRDVVFRSHRVDHSSRLVFQTSQERQSRPQQLVGINSD
jgi:hypothetical protein